jgi:DNA-binding beta-propeller fold protein YncE
MKNVALAALFSICCAMPLACGGSGDASPGGNGAVVNTVRARQLGDGTPESVTLTEVIGPAAHLLTPRDLAFNPLRPNELWVVNFGDDSMVIVSDVLADPPASEHRKDAAANHFMAKPSSLAFGASETTIGVPGTFATCQESRNTYDDMATPNDFMGPTLWSSDLSIFAERDPNGLGSHLDMLHNSPLCVGIAHESANVYWTFAGRTNSIVKYDFGVDDHIGEDDHSDGRSWRYGRGAFKYEPGVPSHLAFDPTDAMLYIADTGNGRIAKLDTTTGAVGNKLATKEPNELYVEMVDATITDVVPPGGELQKPSGLELHDGYLFVSDNATSKITAFTLTGEKVNQLDTALEPGSLAGMAFGPDGKLYLVDMKGNRVLRVDVKPH